MVAEPSPTFDFSNTSETLARSSSAFCSISCVAFIMVANSLLRECRGLGQLEKILLYLSPLPI